MAVPDPGPEQEALRAALWLQNRASRLAKRGALIVALRGSGAARVRLQNAWSPLLPWLPMIDDDEDDPQLGNWNGP